MTMPTHDTRSVSFVCLSGKPRTLFPLWLFAVGVVFAGAHPFAHGQIFRQWRPDSSGEYGDASRWFPATSPGPLDTAIFDWSTPAQLQINFSQNHQAAEFQLIDGDALFVNDGPNLETTYTVAENAKVERNGHLQLASYTTDRRIVLDVGGELINRGQLTIGENSTVNVTGFIDVGGTTLVTDRGLLIIHENATVSSSSAGLAADEGFAGSARVAGTDTSWDIRLTLWVGAAGIGELDISEGAVVTNGLSSHIGLDSGSEGVVRVDGVGSDNVPTTWTSGRMDIGQNGRGELEITGGANVTHDRVDAASDGTAIVHVNGGDGNGNPSTWTTGNLAASTFGGTTLLTFDGGARVNSDGVILYRNAAATITGADATGNPTRWNTQSFNIYEGKLDIEDGAIVSSEDVQLSDTATVRIRGADANGNPATWNASGLFAVGGTGRADVIVTGASLSSGTAEITSVEGSTPNSLLVFENGQWVNSGDVFVGGTRQANHAGSDAVLRVTGPDSHVEIGGELTLWNSGTVQVEDGFVAIDRLNHTDGGTLMLDGGTVQIDRVDGELVVGGSVLSPGPAANLTTVNGNLTLKPNAVLALDIGGLDINHDLVNVTSVADIDGLLTLSLIDGFVPGSDDEFTVLVANAFIGAFDNVSTGQRIETTDGRGSFVVNYGVGSAFDPNRIVLSDFQALARSGDFDGDGLLTATDIDLLSAAFRDGSTDPRFDLDTNGFVDQDDRTVWIKDLKSTSFGDANLDGEFNSGDLVAVFTAGKYETGEPAVWAEGDWNGDGNFESGDLVVAFSDGGYDQGLLPSVVSVPEPVSFFPLSIAVMGLAIWRRQTVVRSSRLAG